MKIKPCTLREANAFVIEKHRHSKQVRGCKFCIGALVNNKLVGVAIVGRPVARKLDDGFVGEIVRTCTDGTKNINSFLYGACARIWKEMGGTKIITYTLETESGISLKAAGFKMVNITQAFPEGKGWTTRKNREWQPKVHSLKKLRWEYEY
jgi:hypothetical protein|tara:strand:- start:2640 stop:3092 length:453 start_codon:yes stop_codon:yes gene_type:complete